MNTTPQPVQSTLPLLLTVTLGEAEVLLASLHASDHPARLVNPLLARLQAAAQQQVAAHMNPAAPEPEPVPPLPPIVEEMLTPHIYTCDNHADARQELEWAELARRDPSGGLDLTPPADPQDDYAAAFLLVGRAVTHLEEAIPNAQRERALRAYSAMVFGVAALGRRLDIMAR